MTMEVAYSHYWLLNEYGDFYETLLLVVIPIYIYCNMYAMEWPLLGNVQAL
jgi:hypothetical protein